MLEQQTVSGWRRWMYPVGVLSTLDVASVFADS